MSRKNSLTTGFIAVILMVISVVALLYEYAWLQGK